MLLSLCSHTPDTWWHSTWWGGLWCVSLVTLCLLGLTALPRTTTMKEGLRVMDVVAPTAGPPASTPCLLILIHFLVSYPLNNAQGTHSFLPNLSEALVSGEPPFHVPFLEWSWREGWSLPRALSSISFFLGYGSRARGLPTQPFLSLGSVLAPPQHRDL